MAKKVRDVFEYGSYAIDRTCILGGGTFGTVYKGRDDTRNRDIAVKFIALGSFDFAMKEVSALTKVCNHRNIVEIFDVFEHAGRPWIVMEFLDGFMLNEYVTRTNPKTIVKINMISQCINAVEYMHNQSIAHRDIKPSNILVSGAHTNSPLVKLCDFGLAKIIEEDGSSRASTVAGTMNYMAPELFSQYVKYNPKAADIFSMGLVMLAVFGHQDGTKFPNLLKKVGQASLGIGQEMNDRRRSKLSTAVLDSLVLSPSTCLLESNMKLIISRMICYEPCDRVDASTVKEFINSLEEKMKSKPHEQKEADVRQKPRRTSRRKQSSECPDTSTFKMGGDVLIHAVNAEITTLSVEAVVYPTGPELRCEGDMSKAAGSTLRFECKQHIRKNGLLEVTETLVTAGGNLQCQVVIHAVCPCLSDYDNKASCYEDLSRTITNCLAAAQDNKLTSLAIPVTFADSSGISSRRVIDIIAKASNAFISSQKSHIREIFIVASNEKTVSTIQQILSKHGMS